MSRAPVCPREKLVWERYPLKPAPPLPPPIRDGTVPKRRLGRQRPGSLLWSHGSDDQTITVIVPAFNEAEGLGDTIRSLQSQTRRPAAIIVVDDCSTDGTGDIARSLGATVVRPPANTGSKAGAQNFGLRFVRTALVMAVDADTVLAPDAVERLLPALGPTNVAAACGFVVPRYVHTVWERGRYIEYLFAFTFYKQVQEFYGKPLISSGCFSLYRTVSLRAQGGWSTRTLAEDMDLTWCFYRAGLEVRFVPEAVCYPIEPRTFRFMGTQLRRWSHGFVQNVRLHWRSVLDIPFLRSAVAVSFWDATVAAVAYLILLPVLALLLGTPWLLLGCVIDASAHRILRAASDRADDVGMVRRVRGVRTNVPRLGPWARRSKSLAVRSTSAGLAVRCPRERRHRRPPLTGCVVAVGAGHRQHRRERSLPGESAGVALWSDQHITAFCSLGRRSGGQVHFPMTPRVRRTFPELAPTGSPCRPGAPRRQPSG